MNAKEAEKIKIIVSDCHLSAGRFFEGRINPHEDFHFDEEMAALFEEYSTEVYTDKEVELILGGDYFDFLNVPIDGEFDDAVTEEVAVRKAKAVIAGHPIVMKALRDFVSKPKKSITYLIGNHDADLFFEGVRRVIIEAWDPEGSYPSEKVKLVHTTDRITYPEGFEVRHGNQLEAVSDFDFDEPFMEAPGGEKILRLPWSSVFVLKIVNRLKWERESFDKIRPARVFIMIGLIVDPWFTIRFVGLSLFYFMKTRLFAYSRRRSGLREAFEVFKQESKVFQDLEEEAREILDTRKDLKTIIFGHTHKPMNKVYPDGKQYINTGTWVKMMNVNWSSMGTPFRSTYAYIEIKDGQAECELRQWLGEYAVHRPYLG